MPRDAPRFDYPAFVHAAFVAGMYGAFLRQGEAVRWTHQRDNTLYFRPYTTDFRPINPGAHVLRVFAEPFAAAPDGTWHLSRLDVDGPTFDVAAYNRRQRATPDVDVIDATAVVDRSGDRAVVFLTNRDPYASRGVTLALADGWRLADPAEAVVLDAPDVWARQLSWDGPETFSERTETLASEGGALRLTLAPAAVSRLTLSLQSD